MLDRVGRYETQPIGTQIEDLRSTGDIGGKANFQKVGFLFCVLNPISGRGGGCFHPPLRFFGDISETAKATRLKFSDFS